MLGSLISAGASLIGGLLGNKQAEANRNAQIQMANNNIAMQDEFAKSGIQWRVEDAKAAGIHPLAALGAQTSSFSPVQLGDLGSSPLPSSISAMGQDLSRAFNATRSQSQRDQAFNDTARSLELSGKQLDNDLKATTLASSVQRLKQSANPPIPEGDAEKRPPLFMGGFKWGTDPNTSNMEDFEKRYGDDGPASWIVPPMIGWHDYRANSGGASIPGQISRSIWDALKWADRNIKVFGR